MSRHPAVQQILRWFEFAHLPPRLRSISREFYEVAYAMVDYHELSGPEATVGLRKLLEAKDAFVRAELERQDPHPPAAAVIPINRTGALQLGGEGTVAA